MSASPSTLPAPNTDLIANVFDALPLAAFVVDHDFNVIDFNLAGARLLDRVPFAVLRLRGGDQLQCLHSIENANGGATEPCQECVVKNFVREIFGQSQARRRAGRLRLSSGGRTDEMDFLITVAPIPDESEPLALVLLDDAAGLSALIQSLGHSDARPRKAPGAGEASETAGAGNQPAGSTRPGASPASSSPGSKGPAKARGRKTDNS